MHTHVAKITHAFPPKLTPKPFCFISVFFLLILVSPMFFVLCSSVFFFLSFKFLFRKTEDNKKTLIKKEMKEQLFHVPFHVYGRLYNNFCVAVVVVVPTIWFVGMV